MFNHTSNLYYHLEPVTVDSEGRTSAWTIQLHSIAASRPGLNPDCKINAHGYNLWIRPRAACRQDFKGYATEGRLRAAVACSLRAQGFKVTHWQPREN